MTVAEGGTEPEVAGAPAYAASELLAATDEEIRLAVEHAAPMVLRGLLYQLTGDEEAAATHIDTDPAGFRTGMMVDRDDDVALLRRKTVELLIACRDSGAPVPIGPVERLRRSASLTLGEPVAEDEVEFCVEELALDPWARELRWRRPPSRDRLDRFHVTVIGAGLGGLAAALMLQRAGIPYSVIEKNGGVGGTWNETRYPGGRLDTPSRAYTHLFGAHFPYAGPFSDWADNQRYFDWVADGFGLRERIAFDTEVRSLTWDERSSLWEIEADGPDGPVRTRSNAVVTAVGFLNRPKLPQIEGMEDFEGPSFHTARWPEELALDQRFAVIGTGCTGYQLLAELALHADHVVAFQRTPQWMFGVPGYLAPFAPEAAWLDRNVPYYTNFMRLLTMGTGKAFWRLTEVDPEFDDPHTVSPLNRTTRDVALALLARKLGHDPELMARMTPAHPPWSARAVMVDEDYCALDAIQRENVTLVTDGIRRITPTGVEAADGAHHEVDAIVYATGFHASEYLLPMTVTGRGGRKLTDLWRDGPRAHRFTMAPGFPNLWFVYGPNTVAGLSPSSFHELVTRYALQCIERLVVDGGEAIEPTEVAYRRFAEELDARNARKVWSDPRAQGYYWTEHGRSAVMCPYTNPEIWHILRRPVWDELEIR